MSDVLGWTLVSADLGDPTPAEPGAAGETGPSRDWVVARLVEGAREAELVSEVVEAFGHTGLGVLYEWIGELVDRRQLGHRAGGGPGPPLAISEPMTRSYELSAVVGDAGGRRRLSRFASLRRAGERWVLETPRSAVRVVLLDPRVADLVCRLGDPGAVAESGLSPADVGEVVALLDHAGMLTAPDDEELLGWEHHDLLFHARSRAGRHDLPYGGTFPLRGVVEPPSAVLPAREGGSALPRPDLDRCAAADPSLTEVLETRRSRRQHDDSDPITRDELAELLFRAARVVGEGDGADYETTRRVYPGGGAAYELEIYPVVGRCAGLEPGLFRYDPAGHRLEPISGRTVEVDALLASAAHAARCPPPQVVLVLAARFGRLFWKYGAMSYATILKDVGVLYQTLYLVGTAMDLAVCALGGGSSDLFAAASGRPYDEEGSVGELMIGRPAEGR